MKILLTNSTLGSLTGTELYVRDVALELRRRGHEPSVFAPGQGPVAKELERNRIPVRGNLRDDGPAPDVIHGHHSLPLLTALLRFQATPAVFFCHDMTAWTDAPPLHPRILRFVAVDDLCRDRLLRDGAPGDRVRALYNWVDLDRFRPRGPLPETPRKALAFDNSATPGTYFDAVAKACRRRRISLDVVGSASGNPNERPESLLGDYDLVFAKGRSAIEALAVGAAVIPCSQAGMGSMVTTENLASLRSANFGRGTFLRQVDWRNLEEEIARYDPLEAARVSATIRSGAGLIGGVDRLIELYREVAGEMRDTDPAAEMSAVSAFLETVSSNHREQLESLAEEFRGSAAYRLGRSLLRPAVALRERRSRWKRRW